MNQKYGYHVVFTTHNSRTSARMIKYNVVKGPPKLLNLHEEIELTKIFSEIVLEYEFRIIAYNVCKDHVHLIIVCDEGALTQIVKVLKGKSSFLLYKKGLKPKGEPLWSQKFFRASLDEWTLAELSNDIGEIFGSSYLENALVYIKYNRVKHKLPKSEELEDVISGFLMTPDQAYFGRK